MMNQHQDIDLATPLSLAAAFRFPVQSASARKELLIGALWLLVPFVGWILNLGHRIVMTHRMQHGASAWPAWSNYTEILKHGMVAFLGMVLYHLPAVLCELAALHYGFTFLHVMAGLLWVAATLAVPGYMSHYCFTLNPREVFNPLRALKRVFQGGTAYWHAWSIAFLALIISFLGLPAIERVVLAGRGIFVRDRFHQCVPASF